MKRVISALLILVILAAATVLPASAADKVTLTYDLMYDGLKSAVAVDRGECPPEAPGFEREGYTLYNYYADPGFKQYFDFTEPLEADTTVYVRWVTEDELAYISLYLSPDDEYPVISAAAVKDEVFGQPSEPAREGKVFAGWYLNKGLNVPYDPTSTIYRDMDLYACFADSEDEVAYYNIFTSPDAEEPVCGGCVKMGGSMFLPSDPEMSDDEILLDWYYNRELTEKADFAEPVTRKYFSLFPKIRNEDELFTVFIYFSPDSEFAVGGGYVEKGQPIPEPDDMYREGFTFKGWYTDRALTQKADFSSPRYTDVELFPRFDEICNHSFTEVAEVPAAATTDGCSAHYYCENCGKIFEPTLTAIIEIEDPEAIVIPATGPYLMGDANGDGRVNIIDATAVQRYIAGLDPGPFCRAAANVIAVDGINVNDVTRIQQYIAKLFDTF